MAKRKYEEQFTLGPLWRLLPWLHVTFPGVSSATLTLGLLQVCPSSAHDLYATYLAVHIRVGLLRRFCELTVFDARLYIRVRRVDHPA